MGPKLQFNFRVQLNSRLTFFFSAPFVSNGHMHTLRGACCYSPPHLFIHLSLSLHSIKEMAMATVLLPLLSLLISVAGDGGDSGELWCVAKNNAEDTALQAALDWACGPGRADCGPIQEGGPCYSSADLQTLASYAFNDYFVKHGFDLAACDFSGTAAPISLNPSHDKCIFPSSSSARNGNFSGASVGSSTTGLGPAGDDMNGINALQRKDWISTLSFSIVILVAFGNAFG